MTPDEVIATAVARLASAPVAFAAVYGFVLDGGPYHLCVAPAGSSGGRGAPPRAPDVTVVCTAAEFVDIATGRRDAFMAYLMRRVAVQGDAALLGRLRPLIVV